MKRFGTALLLVSSLLLATACPSEREEVSPPSRERVDAKPSDVGRLPQLLEQAREVQTLAFNLEKKPGVRLDGLKFSDGGTGPIAVVFVCYDEGVPIATEECGDWATEMISKGCDCTTAVDGGVECACSDGD